MLTDPKTIPNILKNNGAQNELTNDITASTIQIKTNILFYFLFYDKKHS